jgi:hypothetical protein
VERARATWTDERLDDLSRRVDVGFERVDTELRAIRTELGARIDAQGSELVARIDAQGARIDALQRTMIQVGGGVIASILVAIVTMIATQG